MPPVPAQDLISAWLVVGASLSPIPAESLWALGGATPTPAGKATYAVASGSVILGAG